MSISKLKLWRNPLSAWILHRFLLQFQCEFQYLARTFGVYTVDETTLCDCLVKRPKLFPLPLIGIQYSARPVTELRRTTTIH